MRRARDPHHPLHPALPRPALGRRTTPAVAVLATIALTLAACSSGHARSASSGAAPSTGSSTAGSSGSGSSPSSGSVPASGAGGPAGGPVPAGFDAVSYTAVSTTEFWLLGAAPCSNPVCTSIVRTTDGGAHFVGIPAPPAPLAYGAPAGTSGAVTELRFADPLDGYAFDPGAGPGHEAFWVTHDGGAHWHAVPLGGEVLAFTASGGEAYAVLATCTHSGCADARIARSPARTDAWTSTALPQASGAVQASLSARGRQVWIDAEPGGAAGGVLLHSTDGGATFTVRSSPCVAGLGGTVQATSEQVLWFVCPTGMMARAYRSTDGATTTTALQTGQIVNSSRLAAADDTTAVLASGSDPTLRRTTDGGATFAPVLTPPDSGSWLYLGFTSPTVGVGLSVAAGGARVPATTLWRSTDGGATWRRVPI